LYANKPTALDSTYIAMLEGYVSGASTDGWQSAAKLNIVLCEA